jgi:hypothetical protein
MRAVSGENPRRLRYFDPPPDAWPARENVTSDQESEATDLDVDDLGGDGPAGDDERDDSR